MRGSWPPPVRGSSVGERYIDDLSGLPADELVEYLTARSGLPGPRANLELSDAFATYADRATILRLVALQDEYLRFCGTQAIGRLLVEEPTNASLLELLRQRASEDRWRVREGVARALQILGDADRARLLRVVAAWGDDPDALVRRAAVAAICEPRLLTDPATRKAALLSCQTATESIVALSAPARKSPGARSLRKALGYCWSVAVAADPGEGLPLFERLRAVDDSDVRWIVASNLTKSRLRRYVQ
jgi:HEAT repeats